MEQKIKKIIFLVILCTLKSLVSQGQIYGTMSGSVEFLSVATVESFSGKSNSVNGQINLSNNTLDFFVDINTVTTGIKLRDEHMRENHLETEKYPFAEFSGNLSAIDPSVKDTQIVVAKGDFTIRGKAKSMIINGKVLFKGNVLFIKAEWDVRLADHDIPLPKFLFLKLSDTQKVSLIATLNHK